MFGGHATSYDECGCGLFSLADRCSLLFDGELNDDVRIIRRELQTVISPAPKSNIQIFHPLHLVVVS